jgi:class 3 adenylate cyclase
VGCKAAHVGKEKIGMIESIISSVVSNLVSSSLGKWLAYQKRTVDFDFLIENKEGKKVAIEVLGRPPGAQKLSKLSESLEGSRQELDEFVLVTPEGPDKKQGQVYSVLFDMSKPKCSWIGVNDFPGYLGVDSPGNLKLPRVISELQTNALKENLRRYERAPVGIDVVTTKKEARRVEGEGVISTEDMHLTRQFSFSVVNKICAETRPRDEVLSLGEKLPNVTVVLSDLKDFSKLVKASRSDDLTEIMEKYYRNARDLVFENNGMLDKFIGDAVLAVFNYPYTSDHSSIDAIEFAQGLIRSGEALLGTWQRVINEVIDTGTRIGITTGDVWALNIGNQTQEISLVGDTINLAARLEKNCDVNGILMDNRTRTKAVSEKPEYVESLRLQRKVIKPGRAKGQTSAIISWQGKVNT